MKKMLSKFLMLMVHMSLFDQQTNVTSDAGMSVEMKTFYCDTLIDNARARARRSSSASMIRCPRRLCRSPKV